MDLSNNDSAAQWSWALMVLCIPRLGECHLPWMPWWLIRKKRMSEDKRTGKQCSCLCVSELPPLEWTHFMDLDSVVILEQCFTAFWGFWVWWVAASDPCVAKPPGGLQASSLLSTSSVCQRRPPEVDQRLNLPRNVNFRRLGTLTYCCSFLLDDSDFRMISSRFSEPIVQECGSGTIDSRRWLDRVYSRVVSVEAVYTVQSGRQRISRAPQSR